MLSLIFPYLNFAASLAYLFWRSRDPLKALGADAFALASAEVAVVYASITLITGSSGAASPGESGGHGTLASPACFSFGSCMSAT